MESFFVDRHPKRTENPSSSPSIFWNVTLEKGKLKGFVSWFSSTHGEKKTLQLLEELKKVGFGYATEAGISLGIEDLKIPPNKGSLLAEAENAISNSITLYRKGEITGIEKVQRFIETWHETSESLKQEVVKYFEKTDVFNPVYMMAFSGARGNLSQVRQLVGMRGLMADPQGKIIDFPILSNFREGLTLTEYLISTYGARKGIVDTALRTATAGYLTRRLVDVAQHVLVSKFDCGTQRGIFLFDMKEGNKIIYSFENRLTGRVLAQDISVRSAADRPIAYRNQEVDLLLALLISKRTNKALVRSPLTCETRKSICQLCYGWSLATSRLVSIGEAVGVIAGQSIGEPGTQLTMRTFHTGGVFSGGITEQINAPFSGRIEYAAPIAGSCVRTSQGFLSFLTKAQGTIFLKKTDPAFSSDETDKDKNKIGSIQIYKIPPFTILFARHGEFVEKGQVLIQISALPTGQKTTQTIEQTIYSSLEGEVYYSQLDLLEDIDEKYGEQISKSEDWGKVWVLASKVSQDNVIADYLPRKGDLVSKESLTHRIQWVKHLTQPAYLKTPFLPFQPINNFQSYCSLKNSTPFDPADFSGRTGQKRTLIRNSSKKEEIGLNRSNPENRRNHTSKPLSMRDLSSTLVSKRRLQKSFDRPLNKVDFGIKKKEKAFIVSSIEPCFLTTRLKNIRTGFVYPYPFSFRFHLMKLESKTKLSIPVLKPGALASWILRRKQSFRRKGARKETQKRLQVIRVMDLLKTHQNFFVRRMPMNPKFRFQTVNAPNLLHPVVLNDFVPFFLTYKKSPLKRVFKSLFSKKRCFGSSFSKNSVLYPYLTDRLKSFLLYRVFKDIKKLDHDKADLWFIRKFQENLSFKDPFFCSKTKLSDRFSRNKRLSTLDFNSLSLTSFSDKLSKKNHGINKASKMKFDRFILKTPLLAFNMKEIKHQKLGYFLTFKTKSARKDRFLSFFPITGESSVPSFQGNRKADSKIGKIQTANVSILNSSIPKNTDHWSPNSGEGFCWFPDFSKIKTSSLFSISSPFFRQKKALKNSWKQKTKNLKKIDFKNAPLNSPNLAQSQTNRRSRIKINIFEKTVMTGFIHKSKVLNRKSILRSSNRFQIENSNHNNLLNQVQKDVSSENGFSLNGSENERTLGSCVTIKNSNRSFWSKTKFSTNSFFSTIKASRFFKKGRNKTRTSEDELLNTNNIRNLDFFEKSRLSTSTSVRKSFVTVRDPNFKDFKRSSEKKTQKIAGFWSKTKFSIKNQHVFKTLKTLTDALHKSSVGFHEIWWLNQETYLFRTIRSRAQDFEISMERTQQKNRTLFEKGFNTTTDVGLKTKSLNFYSTNSQGLKKLWVFKEEGLLTLQSVNDPEKKAYLGHIQRFLGLKSKTQSLNPALKNSFGPSTQKQTFHLFWSKTHPSTNSVKNFAARGLPNEKRTPKLARNTKNSRNCFLKLKFLEYLKNKIPKKQYELLTNREKGSCLLNPQKSFLMNSRISRPFFSCVPLFTEKIEKRKRLQIDKDSRSLSLNRELKIPSLRPQAFVLNIKPGWIYKTVSDSDLKTDRRSVSFANRILDDISFDQHRVFVEKISGFRLTNLNRIQLTLLDKERDSSFESFNVLHNVTSLRARFGPPDVFKNRRNDNNGLMNQASCFLIRPFFHRSLQNLNRLKTELYRSMEKRALDFGNTSYFWYKKCFSIDSNLQKPNLRLLNEFLPADINLTWLNSFFSIKPRILKRMETKIQPKTKFRTFFELKKESDRLDSAKWVFARFKKNRKPFVLRYQSRVTSFTENIHSKIESYPSNEVFYVSYRSFNWFILKVSLNLKNSESFNHFASNVSVNMHQTNTLLDKTRLPNRAFTLLKLKYLQLLTSRSFFKDSCHAEEPKNPVFLQTSFEKADLSSSKKPLNEGLFSISSVSDISRKTTKNTILSSRSFFDLFDFIPFFEYSLSQHCGFFGNQKLFSSSFYQYQMQNFLKISVFKDKMFKDSTVSGKRFIKQFFEDTLFSESYRTRSVSMNQTVLKRLFKEKILLGLTNFYSPFEGEILKVYTDKKKEDKFKKSVNVYLEKSVVEERRSEKSVLTRSDLFSLKFSSVSNLSISLKPPIEQGEPSVFKSLEDEVFDPNERLSALGVPPDRSFFEAIHIQNSLDRLKQYHQGFQEMETSYFESTNRENYRISRFKTVYKNKRYNINTVDFSRTHQNRTFRLGELVFPGEKFYSQRAFLRAGMILHLNRKKLTLRKAEFFSISDQAILHAYNGDFILKNQAVMTLPFQTLKTGDIVQGIPRVEQYLEARTTVQGRLFLNSLPVLLDAIYRRYANRLNVEKAVRQSFLKIQQILVDGVQRVYRSQGVSIADKHLEIIVRQMTSKVQITYGGQTGFFPGELIDLEFVERMNRFLRVKIRYEPVVLGITRVSLEVDSFLSAASFQQTTKVLTRAALENKRDFLKGLKENLLVGNLLPAGTGYILPISQKKVGFE